MRYVFIVMGALSALLLSGCYAPHEPLQERAKEVFDMGALPLPGSNGAYMLHGYRVVNAQDRDHFVYIVEQNGTPIQGGYTNYIVSSGKSSHNQSISSAVAPAVPERAETPYIVKSADGTLRMEVSCASEAECARKLARINSAQ